MKKLISILFLFVISLFIANSQSKVMYVDSLKSVTVNVSTDAKKQISSIDNMQLQLAKSVEFQAYSSMVLTDGIKELGSLVNVYTQEVETRNKSDGQLITDKFNYSAEDVKQIMRTERWLNLITWLVTLIYVLSILWMKDAFKLNTPQAWPVLLIQCSLYVIMTAFFFIVLQHLLTLIFNSGYYVIQELTSLYT